MPEQVRLFINEQDILVDAGISIAAAIAITSSITTRVSATGALRAPLCGMGVCQECRVTVNGRPHQLACQILVEAGMHIVTGERT